MKVEAGMTVWSNVFGCNVDVVRVYKETATVRTWGGGLRSDKPMTFRGQRLDSLEQRRQRMVI